MTIFMLTSLCQLPQPRHSAVLSFSTIMTISWVAFPALTLNIGYARYLATIAMQVNFAYLLCILHKFHFGIL